MNKKTLYNIALGISTEVLYACAIMATAFFICLLFSLKK